MNRIRLWLSHRLLDLWEIVVPLDAVADELEQKTRPSATDSTATSAPQPLLNRCDCGTWPHRWGCRATMLQSEMTSPPSSGLWPGWTAQQKTEYLRDKCSEKTRSQWPYPLTGQLWGATRHEGTCPNSLMQGGMPSSRSGQTGT